MTANCNIKSTPVIVLHDATLTHIASSYIKTPDNNN